MKTKLRGNQAENAVAKQLRSDDYEILSQNWRTPRCEIDIIAKKDNLVYFVEVKYRGNDKQGDGLEYITDRKLNQLKFATQIWNQQHVWDGDYRLVAASVTGDGISYQLKELVEID